MGNRSSLLLFLFLIVAGVAGAISFTAVDEGIIRGWLLLLVIVVILALLIAALILKGSLAVRVSRAFLGMIVVVCSWVFAGVLPDPAVVYFNIFRKDIEAHWKIDPITNVVYFPVDYGVDDEGKKFPRNFFVLDNAGTFAADEYTKNLLSPRCGKSKYIVRFRRENVLFLRFYTDGADEPVRSCLIIPISKVN